MGFRTLGICKINNRRLNSEGELLESKFVKNLVLDNLVSNLREIDYE